MDRFLDDEFRDFVREEYAELLEGLSRHLGADIAISSADGRILLAGRRCAALPVEGRPYPSDGPTVEYIPIQLQYRRSQRVGYVLVPETLPGARRLARDLAAEIARAFHNEMTLDRSLEKVGQIGQEMALLGRLGEIPKPVVDPATALRDLLEIGASFLPDVELVLCRTQGSGCDWECASGVGAGAEIAPRAQVGAWVRAVRAHLDRTAAQGPGDGSWPERAAAEGMRDAVPWPDPKAQVETWVWPVAAADGWIGFAGLLCAADVRRPTPSERELLPGLATELAHQAISHHLYRELRAMLLNTVSSLVAAFDSNAGSAQGHTRRVHRLALEIGRELGMPIEDRRTLSWAALLYDIGKIAVPEDVLSASGPPTPEQEMQLRSHVAHGCELVAHIPQLRGILPALRQHHERFDGRGYPDGLAGEAIALHARIIAVADAFDTLVAAEPGAYDRTGAKALQAVQRDAGARFDPTVVAALSRLWAAKGDTYPWSTDAVDPLSPGDVEDMAGDHRLAA